ncbi:MAG: response regulator [Bacteroidetes bacterium]|nr:response regulator [Bacteroidota bacterium]
MEKKKDTLVFIVDDDPMFLRVLENWLLKEMPDLRIKTFPTGEAVLHSIDMNPDIVILDYFLDAEFPYAWNGIEVLKKINSLHPNLPVIIFSAQENIDTALKSINEGAFEYVSKKEGGFTKIKEIILDISERTELENKEKKPDIYKILSIIFVIILITLLLLW